MASVSGTSSMTMSGMTPPACAVALVPAAASVAAGAFVPAVASAAAGLGVASAAGALAARSVPSAAGASFAGASLGVASGCAASLVIVTLVVVDGSSPAGGLIWATAAKLQAANPASVRVHNFSFI